MKIADITKAYPSLLEGERNRELTSQFYLKPGSPSWKLCAKRIARIDAQITATAEKHVAYLSEMRADCVKRGASKDAAAYSARIDEIRRSYADDILLADMICDAFNACRQLNPADPFAAANALPDVVAALEEVIAWLPDPELDKDDIQREIVLKAKTALAALKGAK